MEHNLFPPQIMREAGLEVNDTQKRQAKKVTRSHHTITFPDGYLIDLHLSGVFSYFNTAKPTPEQLRSASEEQLVYVTPDTNDWNPDNPTYAEEEAHFISQDGTMFLPDDTVFQEGTDDVVKESNPEKSLVSFEDIHGMSFSASPAEAIDKTFIESEPIVFQDEDMDNDIDIQLCSVDSTLDSQAFAPALQGTMKGGYFAASIGMCEGR